MAQRKRIPEVILVNRQYNALGKPDDTVQAICLIQRKVMI